MTQFFQNSMFLILITVNAFASNCPEQSDRIGLTSVSLRDFGTRLGCVGTIIPNADVKKRRSLRFFKNGRIMVNTLVATDHAVGARTIFVLPARSKMEMKSLGGIAVQLKDSSGLHWNVDPKGQISTEEKCKLKIKTEISNSGDSTENGNPGGFFLQSCPQSIIIDTGFKRTNDPALDPARKSQIRDSSGNSCEVRNSEIFDYKKEAEQAHLKFKNSKELSEFLKGHTNCKNKIDVSPLLSDQKVTDPIPQR